MILRNTETGEEQRFDATPAGKPGTYEAEVVFPDSGRWAVQVYDGFTDYGNATCTTSGGRARRPCHAGRGAGSPWLDARRRWCRVAAMFVLVLFLRRRTTVRRPPPARSSVFQCSADHSGKG